MSARLLPRRAWPFCLLLLAATAGAAEGFTGDVGVAVFASQGSVRGLRGTAQVLPYVWGDWGPAFARIDTLGIKTVALGAGHLELVARVSAEGWKPEGTALVGLNARSHPLPLGLGTFQRTPWGGLFLYALRDTRSAGTLLEATWGGRLPYGALTLYPQAGVEYRSQALVQHLWGVSAAEAAAGGVAAYRARAVTQPRLGLNAQWVLGEPKTSPWAVQGQWRHTWVGSGASASPLAERKTLQSAYLGLSYALK